MSSAIRRGVLSGVVVVVLVLAGATGAHAAAAGTVANPIRKVVMMLQNMQTKVKEEGKDQAKLFDEFMCYCQTSKNTLEQSIVNGKGRIEALKSGAEAGSNAAEELKAQLAQHQASRTEAKESMATAGAIREKEAAAFATLKSDTEQNVAALKKALSALAAGTGGSFLQTNVATTLKRFAMEKAQMADGTRQELLAFLSGTEEDGEDAPGTDEIIGILKQMGDQMAESLTDATATEEAAIKSFDGLMKAKTGEVDTLTVQIEEEMMRVGEAGVAGASGGNALDDAQEQLKQDSAYLGDLEKSCAAKVQEWEGAKKMHAEELVALSETIKVLNDDEAMEMFKKTLPGASSSFMQLSVSSSSSRARALAVLRNAPRKALRLDLVALALHGKSMGFDEVISMVDKMVATLKKEQADDESKKAYCADEFDKAEDEKKVHELSISDSQTAIDELKGSIASIEEEIDALEDGVRKLDASVEDATEQRKKENSEYKVVMANNPVAKEILLFAKNRLNKFYNPGQYKAPAKRELSEEDRLVVNMGGTLEPTAAPGGIAGTGIGAAFVQVSAHSRVTKDAPPPPPTGPTAHKKKSAESGGVIAMIDLLIKDIDKEMQVSEVEEKDAQGDYDSMLGAAKAKRAEDTTTLTDKRAAKAEAEEAIGTEMGKADDTRTSLMQTAEYIHVLHGECDWFLKNYDMRLEARNAEIEALGKAKAVLSGADFALLQTRRHTQALRR